MQKYSSLKKLKTTPTDSSPQHYRLSTENKTDQGVVSPLRGGVGSDRDDSVDRVSKDNEAVTTTPRSKLESHPSSPASKQPGEDEGDDVDYHPRGATALSYDGDLESSGESEQPVEEEISDDWDSIDDDSEGGGELGYTPWTSLAGSDRPTNRRTSPLSSPFTSPVHGVLPVSPLTKSLHSGDVSPSPSTDKATKTPSVSVDVGGTKAAQSGQKQGEVGSDLAPTLSSSADGSGLTSKLSSAVDGHDGGGGLPQNLSSNVDEQAGHGLDPNLSSNADGVKDGRGLAPTARDPKFGSILAPSLSSNTDAKSGSILAPSLSSNADGSVGGSGLTPRLLTAADAEFGSSLAPCRSTPADIPSTVPSPRSGSADAAVLEEVLTQDDEVSEFDSEDYDHVEDVVALLTATPAQPTGRTAGRDSAESQAQTANSAHVKQNSTPRKHVATPPIGAVTPSSEASLVAVSPLLSEGKAAASVTRTSREGEGEGKEDGSDFFNTDDEDEIEKLLSQAEELRPLKTTTSNEKTAAVSVTATSILMKTEQEAEDLEEEEMSDKKEVGDSQLKKEWPQDQNVEARYEDSEWDSEEEEEEEKVTLHSVKAPVASRDKVKKVESDRDEKMKALLTSFCRREDRGPPQTGLTASVEETVSKMASSVKKEEADKKDVVIGSHVSDKPSLEGDVDTRYEDSEWDSEGDEEQKVEKGEENLTAPPSKKSVTFTTPVTFDVEVGEEEEAGGRGERTYDALLPDSSLPKKSASLSLLTSQLGDHPPLKLPQRVASSDDVIESGQPLVPKLTYMNLPSEKTEEKEREDEDGRKAAKNIAHLEDSLSPTTVDAATTSIVEESVTAKEAEPEAKSGVHMAKEASSPSSKRTKARPELQDDVNVHVAKPSENIKSLTPVSKKDGPLPSSLAKDVSGASKAMPKESGWKLPLDVRPISLHPVAGSGQSSVTRRTGDGGRGFGRHGNRDDTEDDLTSTESDVSFCTCKYTCTCMSMCVCIWMAWHSAVIPVLLA